MSDAGAITITREHVEAVIRAEAQRLVSERVASMDDAQLAPQLDWKPAEWFAEQWGTEPATAHQKLKKVGVKLCTLSQKVRLYSVPDANEKLAARAVPSTRRKRKSKIIPIGAAA